MSTASPSHGAFGDYVRTIEQVLDRRPANRVIIREVSAATKAVSYTHLTLPTICSV